MNIDIPTPAEIAEANRVKDEAADDALLEEWLPRARNALREYRGRSLYVPLPGIKETVYESPESRHVVRYLNRFEKMVQAAFVGTDWEAKVEKETWGSGSCWIDSHRFFTFGSIEERERSERKTEEWRAAIEREYQERKGKTEESSLEAESMINTETAAKPSRRSFWSFLGGNP